MATRSGLTFELLSFPSVHTEDRESYMVKVLPIPANFKFMSSPTLEIRICKVKSSTYIRVTKYTKLAEGMSIPQSSTLYSTGINGTYYIPFGHHRTAEVATALHTLGVITKAHLDYLTQELKERAVRNAHREVKTEVESMLQATGLVLNKTQKAKLEKYYVAQAEKSIPKS